MWKAVIKRGDIRLIDGIGRKKKELKPSMGTETLCMAQGFLHGKETLSGNKFNVVGK